MENNQVEERPSKTLEKLNNYRSGDVMTFPQVEAFAKIISKSQIIPKRYQNNVADCIIAVDIASRMRANPLMVMQHLNIINGTPSWSATFVAAVIKTSGRFTPLKLVLEGSGMELGCYVTCKEYESGEMIVGPKITMQIAKDEGWIDKAGSKWKTMPEVMLRYRAITSFSKIYCSDLLMGFPSAEEAEDIINIDAPVSNPIELNTQVEEVANKKELKAEDVVIINDNIVDAETGEVLEPSDTSVPF